MVVEYNDFFVFVIGFYYGFFVGIDKLRREMWVLYCSGIVVFVWDNEKDIGSIEFYIVIG